MRPLGPFGPSPRILAGVSGGPHSLALILLLHEWIRARGGSVVAGLIDHGLRADSAAEVSTVSGWLGARAIPVRIARLGLSSGPAMQARARKGRLAALQAMAWAEGAAWLALGQHRGDQAETVLLRALAGSGPAGLAGMALARSAGDALVIRPLLGVSPAALEAVVAAHGLSALRDPSNTDPRFTRVRLRGVLDDEGGQGAGVAALAEAAAAFAHRRQVQQKQVAARLAEAAVFSGLGFARLDLAALGQDPVALAALGGLLRAVGGSGYAPGREALAGLLARRAGSLGGAVLTRQGYILREEAAIAPPVAARDGAEWDGRYRLEGEPPPGLWLGTLGPAAAGLERPGWLPAAVARTLPALWKRSDGLRESMLAAVPGLSYPSSEAVLAYRLCLAPLAGPAAE